MTDTHLLKYTRTERLLFINGVWFFLWVCSCGGIHSYETLGIQAVIKNTKRLEIKNLTDEMRNYFEQKANEFKSKKVSK